MSSMEEVVERVCNEGLIDENVTDRYPPELPPWMHDSVKWPRIYSNESTEGEIKSSLHDNESSQTEYSPDGPISSEVREHGIDALAWYIPFHSSPKYYGIYIRESGLKFLAAYFNKSAKSSYARSLEAAYDLLNLHEEAHNHVEVLFSFHEFVAKKRLYSRRNRSASTSVKGTGGHSLTLEQLEEALSNSFAVTSARMKKFRSEAESFAQYYQPIGYRDWKAVKPHSLFELGMSALVDAALSGSSFGTLPHYPVFTWAHWHAYGIPRYLVPSTPTGGVSEVAVCEVCKKRPATTAMISTWGGSLSVCEYCSEHTLT